MHLFPDGLQGAVGLGKVLVHLSLAVLPRLIKLVQVCRLHKHLQRKATLLEAVAGPCESMIASITHACMTAART